MEVKIFKGDGNAKYNKYNVRMIEITGQRAGGDASLHARHHIPELAPRPLYHIYKVTMAQPIGSEAAAGQIRTIELWRGVLDEEFVMTGQK